LNNPILQQHPGQNESVAGVVRAIRRACLLREQGDETGAARWQENEVATAVRDLRLRQGPDALPESLLQGIYVEEARRVSDAAILAELLVPRLVESLSASPFATISATSRSTARLRPADAGAAAPPAGPVAITDLLDAMLAAERNSRRQPATLQPES
jgi:hypothetical protein